MKCTIAWLVAVAGALAGSGGVQADPVTLPPPYVPREQVAGTIRIWGHGAFAGRDDFIETLTRTWEDEFSVHHPGVSFVNNLNGTAAAIGALYTGVGDLALMGREIWPNEIAGFEEVFHYPPTGINIVTGSLDVRNRDYAIVIFAHKDNPLTGMTLSQLDSVFSADHLRGRSSSRVWGDLGLAGTWAQQSVHLYGLPIARGFAEYFETAVFAGGRRWNPDLREFADQPGSKGGATDGGQMMLDALAKDANGIGYAGLLYHNADVKPLAIAAADGGPYVAPTKETVTDHTYPLTRKIAMFFNRRPGSPIDQKIKEFLRYILSREGQEAVLAKGGGYLPMLAGEAAEEIRKLEQ